MDINWVIAFSSGVLCFFAPCVLPLIPSYLIFISGISFDNPVEFKTPRYRRIMLIHSIAFVLGFSSVFVAFGLSSSIIGRFLSSYQIYLVRIGGIALIIMGLFLLNLIKIPFLNREKVIHLKRKPIGIFGSFVVGIAFSLGWTPCIGPALASILLIASTTENMWKGAFLLSMYSLGLAIPLLLSAILFDRLLGFLKRYGYVVKYAQKVMGVLLIGIGLLLLTGLFGILVAWTEQLFGALSL